MKFCKIQALLVKKNHRACFKLNNLEMILEYAILELKGEL